MLEFQRFLYKNLGARIKIAREELGFNQKEFVAQLQIENISIDRSMLSHIETGKTYKKKNPYLLTEDQVVVISKLLKKEPKELIFGNNFEREDAVKLILLAIIMNGAKDIKNESSREEFINPIIDTRVDYKEQEKLIKIKYKELKKIYSEELAKKKSEESGRKTLEEFLRLSTYFINNKLADHVLYLYNYFDSIEKVDDGVIQECLNWYDNNQSFFANKNYFESMEYLTNEPDDELENHSNLLIKLLLGNNEFSQLFMEGLSNRNQLNFFNDVGEEYNIYIDDFINNINQFGDIAVDFKNAGFTIFVKAFKEMWERNNEKFMRYFSKHIFDIESDGQGLKQINDKFIHNTITSKEFSKILYECIEKERYDLRTFKGHNAFSLYLQSMEIKNKEGLVNHNESRLLAYITDMIKTHKHYL